MEFKLVDDHTGRIVDATGKLIGQAKTKEAEALFLAAPEMLAALKEAYNAAVIASAKLQAYRELPAKLDAIIKKAEGGK